MIRAAILFVSLQTATALLLRTPQPVTAPRAISRCTPRSVPPQRSLQICSMESPSDPDSLSLGAEARSKESASRMKAKLRNESRFPLKLPLLGVSAVLGGKGFTDALLMITKVSIKMPGASLSEEFMGVPVLGIDVVCVAAGLSLGVWTWKTMQ